MPSTRRSRVPFGSPTGRNNARNTPHTVRLPRFVADIASSDILPCWLHCLFVWFILPLARLLHAVGFAVPALLSCRICYLVCRTTFCVLPGSTAHVRLHRATACGFDTVHACRTPSYSPHRLRFHGCHSRTDTRSRRLLRWHSVSRFAFALRAPLPHFLHPISITVVPPRLTGSNAVPAWLWSRPGYAVRFCGWFCLRLLHTTLPRGLGLRSATCRTTSFRLRSTRFPVYSWITPFRFASAFTPLVTFTVCRRPVYVLYLLPLHCVLGSFACGLRTVCVRFLHTARFHTARFTSSPLRLATPPHHALRCGLIYPTALAVTRAVCRVHLRFAHSRFAFSFYGCALFNAVDTHDAMGCSHSCVCVGLTAFLPRISRSAVCSTPFVRLSRFTVALFTAFYLLTLPHTPPLFTLRLVLPVPRFIYTTRLHMLWFVWFKFAVVCTVVHRLPVRSCLRFTYTAIARLTDRSPPFVRH